jgi:ubiquitin C-terminal hydrolase
MVVKRFKYNNRGGTRKLSTKVFIPQSFDIDCGRHQDLRQELVTYAPYAVLVHRGDHYAGGHYVTYGQAPDRAEVDSPDNDWYVFDDSTVKKTRWRPWNQLDGDGEPYIIFCREICRVQIE